MTYKPTEAEIDSFNDALSEMKETMLLHGWEFTVKFVEEEERTGAGDAVDARINVSYEYREATISVFPSFWRHDSHKRGDILLHELSHVVTDPLKHAADLLLGGQIVTGREIDDRNETSTSHLAMVISRLKAVPSIRS